MNCDHTTKNKELILQALKMSGYNDMEKLAKCIEDGKVSINGCTTFNVETDKLLVEIIEKYKAGDSPRKLATMMATALKVEANAMTTYHRMNATFYDRLNMIRNGDEFARYAKDLKSRMNR